MMIGKTKALRFTSLFFVILFSLLVNSYIFRNLQIITIFLIFSLVSLVITKYGLKINEKLNLLQSIRDDGPSHHLSKKNIFHMHNKEDYDFDISKSFLQ